MTHTLCVLILLAFLFGPALVIACCIAAQKEPEFNIFGGGTEGCLAVGQAKPDNAAAERPEPLPTNFGNKPMEGRVAMELQDRIENHKL